MADFQISADYKEVAERVDDLYAKFPDAILRGSYEFVTVGDQAYVVYRAECVRVPGEEPCVGTALEFIPGKTPYTKGSEIQNAETSAWGRAIVAAGASRSKKIASADEVRNSRDRQEAEAAADAIAPKEVIDALVHAMNELPADQRAAAKRGFKGKFGLPSQLKAKYVDAAQRFVAALGPDEDPDPAATTPPAQGSSEASEQVPADAQGSENGNTDESSGSVAGAGKGRLSEASPPPPAPARSEPEKDSTAQQRRTLGIMFKELVANDIILEGDKAEIIGMLTQGRTTTSTEITFKEAVKLVALGHMIEQGAVTVVDGDDSRRTLHAERQPGTSFLETLPPMNPVAK